jgi:L-seryl-tRNA(Ser) seleniumtransferase
MPDRTPLPDDRRGELRKLSRIDSLVEHPDLARARTRLGRGALTRVARLAVQRAREQVLGGAPAPDEQAMVQAVAELVDESLGQRTTRVINATGVVLHTNLGRAPLADAAVAAVARTAGGYVALEIDLRTGRRGPRGGFAERALARLTGAEDALVVNNNAAAVLLALTALGRDRAVVVSRGEQVEIGGGFRIPEVLARSGARMIEVGTTNRTRLGDYERALAEHGDVALLLRVHQGNFKQSGFVERPTLEELASLATRHGLLLVEDLGGGAMIDLGAIGLTGEPTPRASIEAGVDLVCFSCDKVLGGPQAGALVGSAAVVDRCRRDPLARALRIGRLPMAALEATVELYAAEQVDDVPALRAMRMPMDAVRARAETWCARLQAAGIAAHCEAVDAAAGGGALAEMPLRSMAVVVDDIDVERLAAELRTGSEPVLVRIQQDKILLDARTVLPSEDDALVAAVCRACKRLGSSPEG